MDKDPHPHATGPTKWRADHCESHHYACDCREWEFATRVAEFERDAERYRWLRNHLVNWCPNDDTARLSWHAREVLDAEIDAAMQGGNARIEPGRCE